MEIAWEEALSVIEREPTLVQTLFIEAYTRHFLRDRWDQSVTAAPRRVVLFGHSVVVLTPLNQMLHVEAVGPIPNAFVGSDGLSSIFPTVDDLIELLMIQQFATIRPDCITFTFRSMSYHCEFSLDYQTWFLTQTIG